MQKHYEVMIVLGSKNDKEILDPSKAIPYLDQAGVSHHVAVISAHRHPDILFRQCQDAMYAGTKVFIGAAGMFPALPGAISGAVSGRVPVLGVTLSSSNIPAHVTVGPACLMPSGRPVAIMGIDKAGLENAALFAASIVAQSNPDVKEKLEALIHQLNLERPPHL